MNVFHPAGNLFDNDESLLLIINRKKWGIFALWFVSLLLFAYSLRVYQQTATFDPQIIRIADDNTFHTTEDKYVEAMRNHKISNIAKVGTWVGAISLLITSFYWLPNLSTYKILITKESVKILSTHLFLFKRSKIMPCDQIALVEKIVYNYNQSWTELRITNSFGNEIPFLGLRRVPWHIAFRLDKTIIERLSNGLADICGKKLVVFDADYLNREDYI